MKTVFGNIKYIYYICGMKVYIYSLNDPDSLLIRYIGKTVNLKRRLSSHINEAKRAKGRRYVLNWIKFLLDVNKKPIINVIEECTQDNWEEREKYWVDYYRKSISNLCNNADGELGGSGTKNYTQEELEVRRKRMSETFSKFPTELSISIWNDIQILSKKEIFKKYPQVTRNIYFQVINGYCWNNITKLPKKVSIKGNKIARLLNSSLKLTKNEIKDIISSKLSQNKLAKIYNISQAHIWRIRQRYK